MNTSQDIPLIGLGKARVVTECNETVGWPERNGMNGSTLARVAEAGG